MDDPWLLLNLAVLVAALFQAATGLGFGLFAGPVLMLVLDDIAAVQIAILLSLMIALILAPQLRRQAEPRLLRQLLIGTVIGLPIGIMIYQSVNLHTLKLLAGAVIAIMALASLKASRSTAPTIPGPPARSLEILVGALSGIMTASLAMPGPVPGAWMVMRAYPKAVIRATILCFFVPVYALALSLQVAVATVTLDTWSTTATLIPATLVGLLCGKLLVSRIDERIFRLSFTMLLLATAVSLLISGSQ